jgi:hypothetical protein
MQEYQNLPDMLSMDKEVYALRKQLTALFYEIYQKVFMRAVQDETSLTPVLEMFLNFGFMDLSFVGEERAKELYDAVAHIDICCNSHRFLSNVINASVPFLWETDLCAVCWHNCVVSLHSK